MKISVKVTTNAKETAVEYEELEGLYKVRLKSTPIEGKANKELVALLAKYFKVPKTSIKIIKGETAKNKIVELK